MGCASGGHESCKDVFFHSIGPSLSGLGSDRVVVAIFVWFVPLNVRFVCCYGNELVSIWLLFLAPRPLTRIPILIRPLHVALLYSALQCTSNPPSAAFRPSP